MTARWGPHRIYGEVSSCAPTPRAPRECPKPRPEGLLVGAGRHPDYWCDRCMADARAGCYGLGMIGLAVGYGMAVAAACGWVAPKEKP